MGHLQVLNVKDYCDKYKIKYFIETGTGNGHSLKYASKRGFSKLFSIEIHEETYNNVITTFNVKERKKISIRLGESVPILKDILESIPKNEPILFWLDAHYPGCYAPNGNCSSSSNIESEIRLPLKFELELINSMRDPIDVILIDDLRVYEKMKGHEECYMFEFNPELFDPVAVDFDKLGARYDVTRMYKDQGYVLFTPKNVI